MIGKRGQVLGEGIIMIYRLLIVAFVALVVLGVSSVFYAHYINVRGAEAMIVARNLAECMGGEGFNLDEVISSEKEILVACGYEDAETERIFVRGTLRDDYKEYIFSDGDSGKLWVNEIFDGSKKAVENIKQYAPGYYSDFSFPFRYNGAELTVELEVLVSDEL